MEKRAQFFLIAAFVIVGIIISMSAVYNLVKVQKEEKWVYDLSKEINQETAQVINQGTLQSGDISKSIGSLLGNYSNSYPDSEIAVIYGTKSGGLQLGKSAECTEPVTSGLQNTALTTCPPKIIDLPRQASDGDNYVDINNEKVHIAGNNYSFDTSEDNYFYIVVRSPRGGTVATTSST